MAALAGGWCEAEGLEEIPDMMPLAIDLFCGLGGWTDGLIAEGYRVVGFDIEQHDYGDGARYPAQLVLQDVLTLHGRQFKDAALIVASPPCQCFSYMAMPWSKAKAIEADYKAGRRDVKQLTALFDACFRIQREACEAAGRHVPMVAENVRGAQKWVGRSAWNFGSFHLWGDVPALMPSTQVFKSCGMNWSDQTKRGQDFTRVAAQCTKVPGFRFDGSGRSFQTASVEATGTKHDNSGWNANGTLVSSGRMVRDGVKQHKSGRAWFADPDSISGSTSSKSSARKAASAAIAKIPFVLARHVANVWKPREVAA